MNKKIAVVMLVLIVTGCENMEVPNWDLGDRDAPKVLSVIPENGQRILADAVITLKFSEAIDASSVDPSSVIVSRVDEGKEAIDDIVDGAANGESMGLPGEYAMSEDMTEVSFKPASPLAGGMYYVIATHFVMSVKKMPLTQHPMRVQSPFVSSFLVSSGGNTQSDEGNVESKEEGDESGGSNAAAAAKKRPESLVINEVLYDAVGGDTDGDVFIELYGEAGGDISSYKLLLISGDDGIVKDTTTFPEGSVIPDDGIFLIADAKTNVEGISDVAGADYVLNFDPQNGPDCVLLVDDKGAALDALGYGSPIVPLAENGLSCFEGIAANKVKSGQSLSREGGIDTDDNSTDFDVIDVPTPGIL